MVGITIVVAEVDQGACDKFLFYFKVWGRYKRSEAIHKRWGLLFSQSCMLASPFRKSPTAKHGKRKNI